MTKHVRDDLNLAHLVARSGIEKPFDQQFLTQANKNGWLPAHLSKNKHIADILVSQSLEKVSIQELIIPCIKNYAQSSQTKYGKDLELFLLEKAFSAAEAALAKHPPLDYERIELGLFYFSFLDKSWYPHFDFNPVDLAISHSNSHFFFALQKSNLDGFIDYFKPSLHTCIGSDYCIKNQTFQIKQQFKQFWNIDLPICQANNNNSMNANNSNDNITIDNFTHYDALKNLEGA